MNKRIRKKHQKRIIETSKRIKKRQARRISTAFGDKHVRYEHSIGLSGIVKAQLFQLILQEESLIPDKKAKKSIGKTSKVKIGKKIHPPKGK